MPRHRLTPLAAVLAVLACVAGAPADWWTFGVEKKETQDVEEVRWADDTAAAFVAARRTGRPILVYVTSANCGYCRKMERETWSDQAVAKRVTEGFVPLKLHADKHPDEVAALRVRAYPTTLLVGPDGKAFAGRTGFVEPEKLIEMLEPEVAATAIRQPLN